MAMSLVVLILPHVKLAIHPRERALAAHPAALPLALVPPVVWPDVGALAVHMVAVEVTVVHRQAVTPRPVRHGHPAPAVLHAVLVRATVRSAVWPLFCPRASLLVEG